MSLARQKDQCAPFRVCQQLVPQAAATYTRCIPPLSHRRCMVPWSFTVNTYLSDGDILASTACLSSKSDRAKKTTSSRRTAWLDRAFILKTLMPPYVLTHSNGSRRNLNIIMKRRDEKSDLSAALCLQGMLVFGG